VFKLKPTLNQSTPIKIKLTPVIKLTKNKAKPIKNLFIKDINLTTTLIIKNSTLKFTTKFFEYSKFKNKGISRGKKPLFKSVKSPGKLFTGVLLTETDREINTEKRV